MSQYRQNGDLSERFRVERTSLFAQALRSLDRRVAVVFLAVVLYGAPDQVIAEKLEIPVDRVSGLYRRGRSSLRHPSRAQGLRDLVAETDNGGMVLDTAMRGLIREYRLEELFAPLCAQCRQRMEATWSQNPRTGRPRLYCSGGCRQKAYRARRRGA
ncbi:hypothetical protein [Streptomyces sp. NPDC001436]